jgi:hypothetical protein
MRGAAAGDDAWRVRMLIRKRASLFFFNKNPKPKQSIWVYASCTLSCDDHHTVCVRALIVVPPPLVPFYTSCVFPCLPAWC